MRLVVDVLRDSSLIAAIAPLAFPIIAKAHSAPGKP
jgi:hypothetical protein